MKRRSLKRTRDRVELIEKIIKVGVALGHTFAVDLNKYHKAELILNLWLPLQLEASDKGVSVDDILAVGGAGSE